MLCFWSCFWRRVCGLVGISPLVGSNLTWECSVDLLPYHFHPEPETGFRSSLIGIIEKARTEDEIGKSSCSWFSLFISSLLWWVRWSLAFPALTKCSRYDHRGKAHICMISTQWFCETSGVGILLTLRRWENLRLREVEWTAQCHRARKKWKFQPKSVRLQVLNNGFFYHVDTACGP